MMHEAETRKSSIRAVSRLVIVGQERAAREEGEDEKQECHWLGNLRGRWEYDDLVVPPKPPADGPQEAAAQPKAAPSFPVLCSA
jgi:hypothetical protein